MKRLEIAYGGARYSIPNRELDEVQQEIADAITSGSAHWLRANSGEGIVEPAYLLVTAGVPIAVIDVMATVTSGSDSPL